MILSKVYFNGIYRGYTEGTQIGVSNWSLRYYKLYNWRIDTYDTETELTTTGDTWVFTTKKSPSSFDNPRPDDYDPDDTWKYEDGDYEWSDLAVAGGGRYKNRIVVVGHNCLYFGDL
jgi:hypothetical protein